ncbi:MAG: helix-turn-helix transcriptional regulator [Firmicutes bacterium]|nr:helix-turn-helix transcriptional regulator [Bacillota bacterium]
MQKSLGERLKLLRDEKKISIAVAAAEMEISQGVLSDYERDKKLPGYEAIRKISHYYDVPYDYLFCETECRDRENMPLNYDLGLESKHIDILKLAVEERKLADEFAEYTGEKQITYIDTINSLFRALEEYPDPLYNIISLKEFWNDSNPDKIEVSKDVIEAIENYNKAAKGKGMFIWGDEYEEILEQIARNSFQVLFDKIIYKKYVKETILSLFSSIGAMNELASNISVSIELFKESLENLKAGDSDNGEY